MFGDKYVARRAVIDWGHGNAVICFRCIPEFYADEAPDEVLHGRPDGAWSESAFYAWTCQSESRARRFAWLYQIDIDAEGARDCPVYCDYCGCPLD